MRSRTRFAYPATALGAAVALVLAELAFRLVVTPVVAVAPVIARDSANLPAITVRQIEEGIATAHFSERGARLTGNPWLDAAPTAVIIGDSYVVAREVADRETMGAWIERLARTDSLPLNVRQYGWRGASPARYVASAADVLARWNPEVVLVPLSNDDLDDRALSGDPPYFRIAADGREEIVPASPARSEYAATTEATGSAVGEMVTHRWVQMRARPPRWWRRFAQRWEVSASPVAGPAVTQAGAPAVERPPVEAVPAVVVHALAKAYGARLVIVYLADVRVTGGEMPEAGEQRLFEACRAWGVTCISTREPMLAARQRGTIARGFPSTTLGVGHLNAAGHRLVANVVWPVLRARLAGRR